jgi:NAD-specific glutamate dehydrogenase
VLRNNYLQTLALSLTEAQGIQPTTSHLRRLMRSARGATACSTAASSMLPSDDACFDRAREARAKA